ncbi:MAG: Rpn family recombination-promoting nuclease/putative transposase [Thermodesulfobacteriota bacterium]
MDLIRYGYQIWSRYRAIDGSGPLPPVIPILFYHGRPTWPHPLDLGSLFDLPEALAPYRPSFRYELIDLARWPDEAIRGEVLLRSFILITKHIFADDLGERLPEVFTLLRDLARSRTGLQYVETLLRYVAAAAPQVEEEAFRAAIDGALADGGMDMPTLAERWEQRGLERGLQQGLAQGLQQGLEQGLEQGLQRGLTRALRRSIVEVLEARFEAVPETMIRSLEQIATEEALQALLKRAVTVASLPAFRDLVRQTLAD